MKEVLKVSISGVSFALESDAHEYLEEIIADIEERIAELLLEKGGKAGTVSLKTIKEVVALLGYPSEIEQQNIDADSHKGGKTAKKLYRDVRERVIAGVCSGLGAYFQVDAVMIRLIFVMFALLSTILGNFGIGSRIFWHIGGNSFGFMILLYLLLWMIVPAAKTVEQRCAMRGKSAGIDDIHKDARNCYGEKSRNYKRESGISEVMRGVLRIAGICIGICLIVLGFVGFIGGMAAILGFEFAENISLFSLVDYIELGISNSLWLKLLAVLTYFIPFLGMLYGGIMLCFKFKPPVWRPGLIMFLLWIVSLLGFASVGVKSAAPYMSYSNWSDDRAVDLGLDTLYVNMEPFDGIEGSISLKVKKRGDVRADYIVGKGKEKEFVKYPRVRVVKHTPQEGEEQYKPFIELKSRVYEGAGVSSYRVNRPIDMESICNVRESVVEVHPRFYTKENKFNGEMYTIWVHVPASMTVILTDENGKVTSYDE